MRYKHFFSIVLLWLALLPAAAWTQTLPDNPEPAATLSAGWGRLQGLARGEEITVARGGAYSVPCSFAGATDNDLFCDSMFSGREYRFSRAEVERVRMEDRRRNMRILIGSFAAVGLVWGLAGPRSASDAAPRVIDGLAGAGVGALAGLVVSVPAAFLIPGRLIYRHSPSDGKTRAASATAEQATAQSSAVGSVP